MKGEVIYLSAYDIAYEANLTELEQKMRGTAERLRLGRLKDAPRNFPVYRPLFIQIEERMLDAPFGPVTVSVSVKLFSIGAISIEARVPFSSTRLSDMLAYRDLRFKDGTTLEDRLRAIAERIFEHVKPQLDTPVSKLEQPEVYTIFCVDSSGVETSTNHWLTEDSTESWLQHHDRDIAALLAGESDPTRLSDQEVQETLKHRYTYYRQDLTVIDWEAALVLDTPEGCRDTLYALEVANLQLEELRVYDGKLDQVLDKAYDDVEVVARPHAFRARQRVLTELREIRMDLTKVADELSNITKFFGDWHLARIYMGCDSRFHLSEWEAQVSQKLRALDGLYTILQQDSTNRIMLLLEAGIVALFIIDLIIILALGMK